MFMFVERVDDQLHQGMTKTGCNEYGDDGRL